MQNRHMNHKKQDGKRRARACLAQVFIGAVYAVTLICLFAALPGVATLAEAAISSRCRPELYNNYTNYDGRTFALSIQPDTYSNSAETAKLNGGRLAELTTGEMSTVVYANLASQFGAPGKAWIGLSDPLGSVAYSTVNPGRFRWESQGSSSHLYLVTALDETVVSCTDSPAVCDSGLPCPTGAVESAFAPSSSVIETGVRCSGGKQYNLYYYQDNAVAGYQNWAAGQPDNLCTPADKGANFGTGCYGENWGVMNSSGQWEDTGKHIVPEVNAYTPVTPQLKAIVEFSGEIDCGQNAVSAGSSTVELSGMVCSTNSDPKVDAIDEVTYTDATRSAAENRSTDAPPPALNNFAADLLPCDQATDGNWVCPHGAKVCTWNCDAANGYAIDKLEKRCERPTFDCSAGVKLLDPPRCDLTAMTLTDRRAVCAAGAAGSYVIPGAEISYVIDVTYDSTTSASTDAIAVTAITPIGTPFGLKNGLQSSFANLAGKIFEYAGVPVDSLNSEDVAAFNTKLQGWWAVFPVTYHETVTIRASLDDCAVKPTCPGSGLGAGVTIDPIANICTHAAAPPACPLGSAYPCLTMQDEPLGEQYCSPPRPCFSKITEDNPLDPADSPKPAPEVGSVDGEGACSGSWSVFNGKDSRCILLDTRQMTVSIAKIVAILALSMSGAGAALGAYLMGAATATTTTTAIGMAVISSSATVAGDAAMEDLGTNTIMSAGISAATSLLSVGSDALGSAWNAGSSAGGAWSEAYTSTFTDLMKQGFDEATAAAYSSVAADAAAEAFVPGLLQSAVGSIGNALGNGASTIGNALDGAAGGMLSNGAGILGDGLSAVGDGLGAVQGYYTTATDWLSNTASTAYTESGLATAVGYANSGLGYVSDKIGAAKDYLSNGIATGINKVANGITGLKSLFTNDPGVIAKAAELGVQVQDLTVDQMAAAATDAGTKALFNAQAMSIVEGQALSGVSSLASTGGVTIKDSFYNLAGAVTGSPLSASQQALIDRVADAAGPAMAAGMLSGFGPTKCCYPDKMSGGCFKEDAKQAEVWTKSKKGQCVKIGTYCGKKWMLACVQTWETNCCFNSLLARIIVEQGRKMIADTALVLNGADAATATATWGSAKKPNCRGFTLEEFQLLDFSLIDFSEYTESLTASKEDIEVKMQGSVQSYAEKIKVPATVAQ